MVHFGNFDITRGRRGDAASAQTVFGSESHRTGRKIVSVNFVQLKFKGIFWPKYKRMNTYSKRLVTKTKTKETNTCPKTPTVRLLTKRPSRWVNKLRLIGRIDEKNFLISKFSLSNEHQEAEKEDVCLRMPKTKAQRQIIEKAVEQRATSTTSILISATTVRGYEGI